jgi:hypothetical protein
LIGSSIHFAEDAEASGSREGVALDHAVVTQTLAKALMATTSSSMFPLVRSRSLFSVVIYSFVRPIYICMKREVSASLFVTGRATMID